MPSSDRETEREREREKSFPLMSNMTRYDEMKKNCGRSKMWSVMLSCTIAQVLNDISVVLSEGLVGWGDRKLIDFMPDKK